MKADFSRGFNPDQKRGKQYRRVLLQQGRVLLDSDTAALVDANDRLLRQEAQDLGTDAGGRGQAFLITPGHLYATFENMAKVGFLSGTEPSELRIDYNARFRDRLPSLLINAAAGGPATVAVDLIQSHNTAGNLVIWAATASPNGVNLGVSGVAGGTYTGSGPVAHFPPAFDRLVFTPHPPTGSSGSERSISITVPAGQRVWIALIESEWMGAQQPFWIQPGRYHVQGLMVENPTEASYPDQAFPSVPGFPPSGLTVPAGQIAVAYLEGWERLVTALQDPGIRERALSTSLDTTVRTAAIGQVKTLSFATATAPTVAQLRAAFTNLFIPDGTLLLNTATVAPPDNPCEIALDSGFTGRENHLYHFEVHSYQPTTRMGQFKWSREAGSELFGVQTFDRLAATVGVLASSPLRNGDLVEVLTDVIELGDNAPATLTALDSGTGYKFYPAEREVGVLAALSAQNPDPEGNNVFTLVQPNNPQQPVTLDEAHYGAGPTGVRLRRWHGLFPDAGIAIPTSGSPALEIPIESGLSVQIQGTFEVGDWWQREARVPSSDNDNGPPLAKRHGPERLFSPLALLVNDGASNRPKVSAWLDQPFVPAAQMDADHLRYDPAVAHQVSPPVDPATEPPTGPTVQGILDDLLLFGPGQTITKQITHVINGQVTGNWQLSVGDGINSFGDINGQDAIYRAVAFVRGFVGVDNRGGQRPWSLRLFVKRGIYTIAHKLTIATGESLTLEGEGIVDGATFPDTDGDDTPDPGAASSATLIVTVGPHAGSGPGEEQGFTVVGPHAKLAFENLMITQEPTGSFHSEMLISLEQQGEIRIDRCSLQNQPFMLIPDGSGADVRIEDALVVRDSTLDGCNVHVDFNMPGSGPTRWFTARVRVESCNIRVTEGPFLRVISSIAGSPTFWSGITIKDSKVRLTGVGDPRANHAGLVTLAPFSDNPETLSIGDLVFENCQVEAGIDGGAGVLLNLPAGPDPTRPSVRSRINQVVIRGGRWTVASETGHAEVAPFYVGDAVFDGQTQSDDTGISRLIVENVAMGWGSTDSSSLIYGTNAAASADNGFGCAFSMSANEVEIRGLTLFGLVTASGNGEIQIRGTHRTVVNGLYLEDFQDVGGGLAWPNTRVGISGRVGHNHINDLNVIIGSISTGARVQEGVVTISAGAPKTLFTNCRVTGWGYSSGFTRRIGGGVIEFINCETNRIDLALDDSGGAVAIRHCRLSGSRTVGVQISLSSPTSKIIIEGTSFLSNTEGGIRIVPDFGNGGWGMQGPTVVNNIILSCGDPAIRIGSRSADNIGGICMGNQCTEEGRIQILTESMYFMRGLAVDGEAPWSSRSRGMTPNDASRTPMSLNCARWSPGVDET